jgi:glycosyltransferase involved in cell wall biosynthesis
VNEIPLRILHLVARSHRRGAELVALELADELDGRGLRNDVVALGPALNGGHEPGLVPVSTGAGVGPAALVDRVRRIRRLLRDEEPYDVILAHGGWAAQVAALAAPDPGPILVWQRILGFPPMVWTPGRRQWWKMIASRFDAGIALSDDLEDELRRLGFDGPVWVIPNFRQPQRFLDIDREAEAKRQRAELGLADDVDLIGFVGHLVDQKRPHLTLEVLRSLLDQGRSVHLLLAGDGPLRSTLEKTARALRVEDDVTFLGHVDDVERVFGAVELAMITSSAEGIPGVAIEAQMAGCPVVTFRIGAVEEVVEHGVTGIVVDPPEPAEMAERIGDLLSDPAARRAMGDEARARSSRFSAGQTADIYLNRLVSLLVDLQVRRRS